MASTNEELIKQMYGANLESQKQQLAQNYNTGNSALDETKQQNQKAADANLNRTAVEAQKQAMSDAELNNAYGLSSGAAAQVRLARDNQTAANMTAIRTAQQEADAQIERERALLSQEYTSAIQKAQADNDLALAQALYENAQAEEEKLLAKKESAANAMAGVGDYSLFGQLYGLSDEQTAKLTSAFRASQQSETFQQQLEAAKYIAEETGDYSYINALYAQLLGETTLQDQLEAAIKTAQQTGNFSSLISILGLTDEQAIALGWKTSANGSGALSAGRSLPAAYISDGNARNSGAEPFNRRLLNILGLK